MAKTQTGKETAKYVEDVLGEAWKAGKAAVAAGYPGLSTYTKNYLRQLPALRRYGDAEQRQALRRAGDLYRDYGQAGRYQKTRFGDIERMYGRAGRYNPADFTMADYTTRNVKERMSPYEKLVSEQAEKRLKKGYEEGRAEREMQAARSGAFGGSGAAIQEEVARRNYLEQAAQMNAQNLQGAYEAAVNLYGKEVADRLSAEQLGEASRQFGKQTQLSGLEGIMGARQQTAAQVAAAKEAQLAALQGQSESARQQALLAEQQKNMQLTNLAALQQGGGLQENYNLQRRMYPLSIAQSQAGVLGGLQGGAQQLLTKPDQPSTFQNILAGAGAIGGILQGAGGLGDVAKTVGGWFRDGGIVYRGGGLADLEPEYYDEYER